MRSAVEQKVYEALCLGPLTMRELSQVVDMPRSTLESPIRMLRYYGVIRVVEIRRRGLGNGSGRPACIYAIVEEQAANR